ncbi:pseudouridine synthase [Lampropedia puyangensis]|uniref:Pseudouridine synthase n=1 Tax=Lampropedia puyangensis TaxID=1330072 RepID=A0A4S8EYM2_9BURK|nr:16S rRNA pseudouridine(516) synthase [Lampropedia puyangensis]THT99688.1 pseudouridine synthase [Lampropedia puyangensis]
MELADILFSQGFGTRRVCYGLVQSGLVQWAFAGQNWQETLDASLWFDDLQGLQLQVQGQLWPYQEKAYLMLYKPAGYECSQKPSAYPSIYTLLPGPLRQRPVKGGQTGVQAIGRLDQDTTGLLLLTDDGAFIHRLSSPKHMVPKVYEVHACHEVTSKQIQALLAGVVLHDSNEQVKADAVEQHTPTHISLTLHAGKYHQVKRMLAAVGNRVETLHRSRIGSLTIPDDLKPGQWLWLTPDQVTALYSKQAAT